MKTRFFQAEVKSHERNKDGVKFKGFASTPDLDRGEDIVRPEAFQKSLDEYVKNPVLLRSHNFDRPVGNVLTKGEDAPRVSESGLFVSGLVTEKETGEQVEAGEIRAMSIGFIPKRVSFDMVKTGKHDRSGQELELEARIIEELDLVEISLVTTPANPKALFTVTKSIQDHFKTFPSPTMKNNCSYCSEENAAGMVGKKYICKSCIDVVIVKGNMDHADFTFETEEEAKAYAELEKGIEEYKVQEKDGVFKLVDIKMSEEEENEEEENEENEEEENEEENEEKNEEEEEEEESNDESETTENEDESSSSEEESEEGSEDGGTEKIVLTDNQKKTVDYAVDLLTEISKSASKKEAKKAKTVKKSIKSDKNAVDVLLKLVAVMAKELKSQKDLNDQIVKALKSIPVEKGKSITAFQFGNEAKAEESKKGSDAGFMSLLKTAKNSGNSVSIG